MKRLLRVSFDIIISSITPIILWFCLSLIVDKHLINIFSITYPLQFISSSIISIFSVGANICKEKNKNKYAVFSGMVEGMILAIIIFGFLIINIDSYLVFMNMDISTYRLFTIFSIIIIFLYLILSLIVNKLYFEKNNVLANYYSFIFNSIYATVLIASALIFQKNDLMIVVLTTISLITFTVFILFKTLKPQLGYIKNIKIKQDILYFVKYDSVDLIASVSKLLIYLFGFSNSFQYGQEYVTALTFCALLTDTQWDAILAIATVVKIDIVNNEFVYKEHIRNSYKLLFLLFFSVVVMFIGLHKYYDLNYNIVFIILMLDIVNFTLYPIYAIESYIIQLTQSTKIATINKFFSYMVRFCCSFLPIPLCTCIGQFTTGIYQYISFSIIKKYIKNR